ncbi:MAG: hypothetical protein FD149_411 [Rhodospirillaceae bacterium]|nr:MAG: hypothetical protein FD149_411 [Rhodospirillaceae bacterium]
MGDFWAMGGHGAFVWPAYGVGLGVLAVLAGVSVWRLGKREAELKNLQASLGDRRCVAREALHHREDTP